MPRTKKTKKTKKAKKDPDPDHDRDQDQDEDKWASLPHDLLEKIHKLLPLPDCHIFGIICKPWRQAAEHPRYKPVPATVPWAMVTNSDSPKSPHLQLYCRSRKTTYTLDLPSATRQCHIKGVYKGWVILLYPLQPRLISSSPSTFLYNPFSRETIRPKGPHRGWPVGEDGKAVFVLKMVVSSSPDDPHSALACLVADCSVHCRWLHRNESFILKNYEGWLFLDIVSHAGSVFLLTRDSFKLVRLNLTDENLAPQNRCNLIIGDLSLIIQLNRIYARYRYMVRVLPFMILSDWDDRLILHHIVTCNNKYGKDNHSKVHNFFIVNIELGQWELLPNLGDKAVLYSHLLVSKGYTTALSATDWGLRRECVYLDSHPLSWRTDGTIMYNAGHVLDKCFTDKDGTRFSFNHQWLLPHH